MLFGLVVAFVVFAFISLFPARIVAAMEWSILLALCWIISQILT